MTSWMKERDRLVEQTLAFVQGVAAQRPISVAVRETALVTQTARPALALSEMVPDVVSETDTQSHVEPDTDSMETDALISLIALSMPTQRSDTSEFSPESILPVLRPPASRLPGANSPKSVIKPVAKRPIEMALPERDVIAQRVARFRAGQRKLIQDREDKYAAVQAQIRATLGNDTLT